VWSSSYEVNRQTVVVGKAFGPKHDKAAHGSRLLGEAGRPLFFVFLFTKNGRPVLRLHNHLGEILLDDALPIMDSNGMGEESEKTKELPPHPVDGHDGAHDIEPSTHKQASLARGLQGRHMQMIAIGE
jgi:hypothetical protein